MKGRKEHHERHEHHEEHREHHREHRETGGVNEAEEDLREKTPMRVNAPKIEHEADERKHGGHVGRRKRKHGGEVHHSRCKCEKCMGGAAGRKHGGHVMEHKKTVEMHGEHARHHAGHKPRKDGGRTGSNEMPFSSAHHGSQPAAHKAEIMD